MQLNANNFGRSYSHVLYSPTSSSNSNMLNQYNKNSKPLEASLPNQFYRSEGVTSVERS
jgi:hypothetical protein